MQKIRLIFIFLILGFFVVSGLYNLTKIKKSEEPISGIAMQEAEKQSEQTNVTTPKITQLLQMYQKTIKKQDAFQNGDTLSRLLARNGVSAGEIAAISIEARNVTSLKKIKLGAAVDLTFDFETNQLIELELKLDLGEILGLEKKKDGWSASIIEIPGTVGEEKRNGTISSSLWAAAQDASVPSSTILDLADLFGWQIDFATDLREGDQFSIIFEMVKYPSGEERPGEITAAVFENQGKEFSGFRFKSADGKQDYYDAEGNSMRRTFLKSPLRYRTISSYFSHRRFHPILKIYRPHLGVDYAAPSGTPVSTLGDGTIIFCGRKGGYGNYVEIKHGDAYKTCYGHLKGFGKGIKRGVKVCQGQVIGYVGATGLATGPHLDFRVKYRDQFINPLTMKSPASEPLESKYMEDFAILKNNYLQKLAHEEIKIKKNDSINDIQQS